MASTSTVPKVKVAQVEGGTNKGAGGFVVTCTACPNFRTIRKMRIDADIAATGHARIHARPFPADEVD